MGRNAWTQENLAETAAVVHGAAAEGILKAIRDELTQIGNRAGAEHRRDLDYVLTLVLRLRAVDSEAARYARRDLLSVMTNHEHSIEEIRDVWLSHRGADGSDWEASLGAVYNFAALSEREACVALARGKACVCQDLEIADYDIKDFKIVRHDHRCPQAIADAILARGEAGQ